MPAATSATGLSFASGGDIALDSREPASLARRIGDRVEANPGGIIRSYREGSFTQARSHAALWRQAGDIAAALSAAGAVASSFVVILAEDILDFLPSTWACLRGGFVPVALMSAARDAVFHDSRDFEHLLSSLPGAVFIVDDYFGALITRLPHAVGGKVVSLASVTPASAWCDHPGIGGAAWLVATSGSTGRLKLVTLSAEVVLFRNFASNQASRASMPNAMGIFPLDSVTGQHAAFLHSDSWTQISPHAFTARPTAILDAIETCEITTVTLTSSMIRNILAAEAGSRHKRRLGSLRLVGLGAEPILPGLVQDFAALIARHGADPGVIIAGYGTTETGSLVAGSRALLTTSATQPVCLGRPWFGVSMRIVDDSGVTLPARAIGQLEVLSPAKMFSGYLNDPELTAAAFTADGWWKTGDLGQLIDGELTLHGRAKDVLIQNGRKLSLADIDQEIQQVLGLGGVGYGYCQGGTETRAEALGVAFDAGDVTADLDAAAAIRTAIVRRFGIQPGSITPIQAASILRTSGGKVRRAALAALAQQAGGPVPVAPPPAKPGPGAERPVSRLGTIWCKVLGLDRAARLDDQFFDLGGDSLRAVTLDLLIGEEFGIRIPSEAFFAKAEFGNLLRLITERLAGIADVAPQDAPGDDIYWPLPAAMRLGLSSVLALWSGERSSDSSTITGHNIAGDRPPIFWVFNVPIEAAELARALGPRQPLYAMRSGNQLMDYHEDEIQSFALRYVAEITQLCPIGPVFVGGNCQGGIIALAIAQHLLRRKRHIPLLVLMDWSFQLQPYQGDVLLLSGVDNANHNPRRLFASPERAWARGFAKYQFAEISGGYADGFQVGHIDVLARTLLKHMQAALCAPPTLMPDSGYRATIAARHLPKTLRPGDRRTVRVSVTNSSNVAWAPTSGSGLVLSSRWLGVGEDVHQPPQPAAKLPKLGRNESAVVHLAIVAPTLCGDFTVVLDLLEEGNRWFYTNAADCFGAPVRVAGKAALWRQIRRFVGRA